MKINEPYSKQTNKKVKNRTRKHPEFKVLLLIFLLLLLLFYCLGGCEEALYLCRAPPRILVVYLQQGYQALAGEDRVLPPYRSKQTPAPNINNIYLCLYEEGGNGQYIFINVNFLQCSLGT